MNKALIFDIQRGSYVDGPGIRTTVFFKGCNLKCKWCHNPESQYNSKQILFYKNKCSACGKCKSVCPYCFEKCDFCGKCAYICPNHAREVCGKEYTIEEVFNEIIKDKRFYQFSKGGVTFSGGECLLQIDFLEEILRKCKQNDVHTAIDTAGCVPWEYFERILPYTDLFLFDVKCISENLHKEGTGASNRLILNNLQKLKEKQCKIIVRVPLIIEFNCNDEEMGEIAKYLNQLDVEKVELLPYHAMGEYKWDAIGLNANQYTVPTKEQIKKYSSLFNKK